MTDDEIRPSVEWYARELATWYGSAFSHSDPDEGFMHTVASAAGYGRFAGASSKYAEKHWMKFRGAANFVIERLEGMEREMERLRLEVEVLRIYGNKDCTAMADAALEQKQATGKGPWED